MKRTALPLRRTPLRKVSSKRSRELREYSKKRKAFLEAHPWCQVTLARFGCDERMVITNGGIFKVCGDIVGTVHVPRSCDIHHKAGRTGWRLNDESQWLAVSREAHEWIHANPSEARRRGWLV